MHNVSAVAEKQRAAEDAEKDLLEAFSQFSFLPDSKDPFIGACTSALLRIHHGRSILVRARICCCTLFSVKLRWHENERD